MVVLLAPTIPATECYDPICGAARREDPGRRLVKLICVQKPRAYL